MAGIIESKMGAQEPVPPQGAAMEEAPEQQGMEEQADPRMQDGYDRVMDAFSQAVHNEKQAKMIVESLQGEDPEQTIASHAINILTVLDEKSGGKIPSELLIAAAVEGAELIAELGERAGFYEFDEAMQARVMQQMMALAVQRGIIDQAEIEELIASMDPAEVDGMVAQQAAFAQPQQQRAA